MADRTVPTTDDEIDAYWAKAEHLARTPCCDVKGAAERARILVDMFPESGNGDIVPICIRTLAEFLDKAKAVDG